MKRIRRRIDKIQNGWNIEYIKCEIDGTKNKWDVEQWDI